MAQQNKNLPITHSLLWYGQLLLIFFMPLIFSTSLYRSFEIPKAVLLRVGAALLLLVWAACSRKKCCFTMRSLSAVSWAVLLFFAAAALSIIFSLEPALSLFGIYDRQLGLLDLGSTTILYVLMVQSLSAANPGSTVSVLRVMVLSGTLMSAYALAQYLGLDPIPWSGAFGRRPGSTLGHPDYVGALLVMTVPLGLALISGERKVVVKIGWVVCTLVQTAALLVSQTRGAWIAGAVSVPAFLATEPFLYHRDSKAFRRSMKTSMVLAGSLIGCVLLVFVFHEEFRQRAATIANSVEHTRIYLWRDSLEVIKEHPVFGSGFSMFRLAFMPHKGIELARLEKNTNYDHPHNHYLYVWTTTGALGILAYLSLLVCSVRAGVRNLKARHPLVPPGVSLGLLASLGGYGLAMLTGIDTIATMVYFYAVTAVLAAGDGGELGQVSPRCRRLKQAGLLLAAVLLTGFVTFDSLRIISADHLALQGLVAAQADTPASFAESRTLLQQAADALPRESFYSLQAGAAALRLGLHEGKRSPAFQDAIAWGYRSLVHGWAPENSWNLISTSYLNRGQWAEAEQASRQGLALDPYNMPLMYNRAKALAYLGRRHEALEETERILSIYPAFTDAQELRRRLE